MIERLLSNSKNIWEKKPFHLKVLFVKTNLVYISKEFK